MADTDSKNAPSAPNAPKPGAKAGAKAKAEGEAGADALREHLSTVALVAVIAAALTLVIVFQVRKGRQFDAAAWTALAELRQRSLIGTEGFAELAAKYRGSEADPFIRLTWAARLYEAGGRDQVREAKELLEQILREHPDNEFLRERVTVALKNVEAELADPRAQLAATPTTPATPSESSTPAETAPVGTDAPLEVEAGDHGPDDGHGHGPDDGHGH